MANEPELIVQMDDRKVREGDGVFLPHLRRGDELIVTVGRGALLQDLNMVIYEPSASKVVLMSAGHWGIMTHICVVSGCSGDTGKTFFSRLYQGWLYIGLCPNIGPFILPPITRIALNGFDIAKKSISESN
jgi:hypothetical protein